MENLQISGVKRIAINGDVKRVIEFNPSDILFVERFYKVYHEFQEKQVEYNQRVTEMERLKKEESEGTELTEDEMMKQINEGIAFFKEVCIFTRGRIDYLVGEGSSQKIFGDALSMDEIGQFFEGFTPFVWEAREKQLKKHSKKSGGTMK